MSVTCAWSAELTYDYLERLLNNTREAFELRLLCDGVGTNTDPPRAVIRHDVDVCLWRAVAMAEHEAEWGVAATYLVQVDSPLYRLDDDQGRAALRRLTEAGHEIGLHVDVGPTLDNGHMATSIEPRVRAARERLQRLIDAPVESVSFHRPVPEVLRGPDRICGMVNGHGRELMTAYLSDSEGRWRHGEPLPHVRAAKGRFLQLLIHPIWWDERHLAPRDRLQEFFEASIETLTLVERETFDIELLRAVEPPQRSGLG